MQLAKSVSNRSMGGYFSRLKVKVSAEAAANWLCSMFDFNNP